MKKVFMLALVGVVLSVATYGVYKTQSREETMSDFMLANIEALGDNDPETGDFKCALHKDDCDFTITSESQIPLILKKIPFSSLFVGLTVDLSSGTEIYTTPLPGEPRVKCGENITCNAFLRQLGII